MSPKKPARFILESHSGSAAGTRAVGDILIRRWVRVFEWLGIAILLLCAFFAGRSYLGRGRLSAKAERTASVVSKLVARLLR